MNDFLEWAGDGIGRGDIVSWVIILGLALLASLLLKGALHLASRRLNQLTLSRTGLDDLLATLLVSTKTWFLFFLIFYYFGLSLLEPSEGLRFGLRVALVVVAATQVALWGVHAIRHWRKAHFEKRAQNDATSLAAIGLLATALQGLFIIIVILFALSNLGVDVGALIAGLGIGGIAVALAAQNILGDLFASVSIVLDKPFVIGDFINVGEMSGTVEHIGLRTTRVRSLSGEQMVFSNRDLLESRIRNYKSMWQRRITFHLRVPYSTPLEKLEQIPKWIQQFIEEDTALKFDRSHFASYGEFSLNIETVFFVKDSSYSVYMDHQEELLLKLARKLQKEGIELALPTQTLHVGSLPEPLTAQ